MRTSYFQTTYEAGEEEASIKRQQNKAVAEYLWWVLDYRAERGAYSDATVFGSNTPNRLFNEYAGHDWRSKFTGEWFTEMSRRLPVLASLAPTVSGATRREPFAEQATPPAILKHYRNFYRYIQDAFIDGGISRSVLDERLGAWAAESIRLLKAHLQEILKEPADSIDRLRIKLHATYGITLTQQQALYYTAAALHTAFSNEALVSYYTDVHHEDIRQYLSRFMTYLFPDSTIYVNQALPTDDPFALLEKTGSLYANIVAPQAAILRSISLSFLKNPYGLQPGDYCSTFASSLSMWEGEDRARVINRLAQLLTEEEFLKFCREIDFEASGLVTIEILNKHLSVIADHSYAKFVATLIYCNQNQCTTILGNVHDEKKSVVITAYLKLISKLIEEKTSKYLRSKIKGFADSIVALDEFKILSSDQKAERNIASAYQILALLQQLKSYNEAAHSDPDKALAYKAVMQLIQNVQREAAIRGYRSVKGQSSHLAQLLDLDIPLERATGPVRFPHGFDLSTYREIGRLHKDENTWFNKATKKFNNWAKQNPWAIFAAVMSVLLISVGAAALAFAIVSPAALVVVPLVGLSVTLANLLLPAAITLGLGVFLAVFTAGINETRNTAAAKLKRQGFLQEPEVLESPQLDTAARRSSAVAVGAGGVPHGVSFGGISDVSTSAAATPTSGAGAGGSPTPRDDEAGSSVLIPGGGSGGAPSP